MQNSKNQQFGTILAAALVATITNPSAFAAKTCVDSNGMSPCMGTTSPCVCAEFSTGAPLLNGDFVVDFSTPAEPDVTLRKGNTGWIVWSKEHATDDTPDKIGVLSIDPTVASDDFEVSILNNDIAGDGASEVGQINLNDAGFTGYSSVEGGVVSGNVGAITVVDDGSTGGEITFEVEGSISGNVNAEKIVSLKVGTGSSGNLTGDLDVNGDIDELVINGNLDGAFDVSGDVDGSSITGNVTGALDLGTISSLTIGGTVSGGGTISEVLASKTLSIDRVDTIELFISTLNGSLEIDTIAGLNGVVVGTLNAAGSVTIDSLTGGKFQTNGLTAGDVTFGTVSSTSVFVVALNKLEEIASTCTITYENGLPSGAGLTTWAPMNGTIDMTGGPLAGTMTPYAGGTGELVNGGELSGLIETHITHSDASEWDLYFSSVTGQIEFQSAASTMGWRVFCSGDYSGSMVMNNSITSRVFGSRFLLDVGGDLSGTVDLIATGDFEGDIDVGDDLTGSVTIDGDVGSSSLIYVTNQIAGDIEIMGDAAGQIDVDGGSKGSSEIEIAGNLTNTVSVAGSASGDILVGGDVSAAIDIGGSLTGDIDISGDANSTIDIGDSLGARGRILVGGVLDSAVTIENGTNLSSQITFSGGMDTNASVVLNDSGGFNSVQGDILVGVTYTPLPSILDDGCITTKAPASLTGTIDVVGCHDADNAMNICGHTGTFNVDQGSGLDACSPSYSITASCGTCP